jgi:hypothetical protein
LTRVWQNWRTALVVVQPDTVVAAHVKPRKSGPASRASAMAISASVSALASASGPARPPVCDRTPRQSR